MKKLPKDYVLLKQLNSAIEEFFEKSHRNEVSNLSEIYDYIKRRKPFCDEFKDSIAFSRFMRRMHDQQVLKQIIKNCTVDTTIYYHYKWCFYPKDHQLQSQTNKESQNLAKLHNTTVKYFLNNKVHRVANGIYVRSTHELYILNELLTVPFFEVYYERPLTIRGTNKIPDFTIINKRTNIVYHWEHFGMTNNEVYMDKMSEKLKWYREIGYKEIDKGGNLIITIYENDKQFIISVKDKINKMMK